MKKILTLIPSLMMLGALNGDAQVFWTENFTGGSTGLEVASYSGSNGAWSLAVTGSEGADPNPWFVSCQEAGHLAGDCGTTCATSAGLGESLHVGSVFSGDNGASYDAGGLCGVLFCPQTDRRAQSPTINCTGKTNIRLKFYYILNGQGTTDDGSVWYSPDNGSSWSLLMTPPKTTLCSGQGRWDSTGIMLPASANNNAAVKIGFRWVNNDDGVGTDPSFAVDSVSLRTASGSTGPLVPSMTTNHTTICSDSSVIFTNTSTGTASIDSFTWTSAGVPVMGGTDVSPLTITFPTFGTYPVKLYLHEGGVKVDSATTTITVNKSPSPVVVKTGSILSVSGAYTSYQWYNGLTPIAGATTSSYTFTTPGIYGILVDSLGCKGIGAVNTLSVGQTGSVDNTIWIDQQQNNALSMISMTALDAPLTVSVYDATGRTVATAAWPQGARSLKVSDIVAAPGIYLVRLSNDNTAVTLRWLKH